MGPFQRHHPSGDYLGGCSGETPGERVPGKLGREGDKECTPRSRGATIIGFQPKITPCRAWSLHTDFGTFPETGRGTPGSRGAQAALRVNRGGGRVGSCSRGHLNLNRTTDACEHPAPACAGAANADLSSAGAAPELFLVWKDTWRKYL